MTWVLLVDPVEGLQIAGGPFDSSPAGEEQVDLALLALDEQGYGATGELMLFNALDGDWPLLEPVTADELRQIREYYYENGDTR